MEIKIRNRRRITAQRDFIDTWIAETCDG